MLFIKYCYSLTLTIICSLALPRLHPSFWAGSKGGGARTVVSFGVVIFLFVRAADLALFCVYRSKL
jgi:hypothetical protein